MMAKIVKGGDFKGVVNYILDKEKGTQVVAHDGLFLENKETIAMSFNVQSQMNNKVAKPVGHIALSFSKEDEPRLTNRVMAGIALEYMERMGIRNTQFLIARHFDKEHPHVHIAFNRIDNNGNTISDRNERLRSTRICRELTLKYGLYMADGKENVKRNRLKEPDKTKYELYAILKTETGRCGNWNVLVANLNRQGVEVRFKYKGQTNEVQGVVFTVNSYRFNGSKVDRRFSYSRIDAALQRNRMEEQHDYPRQEQVQPNRINPDKHDRDNFIGDSLGLFASNANNVPEERELYDPYLRNRKKRKKQRKINW
ncbi:relaxase/mobilization nuclease domain-containing protein [Odoribacter lunatus]|uniref:relaxase/mobilization nuclease domain-containing protein n=1 Tax=Odoribacter lunatus TaxID=2941335 RepID=UPI00203BC828|nr:relaxase/mobilization nuclease domain-containing protein [Odoribacter lunatus]